MRAIKNLVRVVTAAVFLAGVAVSGSGQSTTGSTGNSKQREPSTTTQPYVVLSGQASIAEVERGLRTANEKQDLVGKNGGLQTLMYVQHESNKESEAEVHDAGDDYHIVLEGTARYTLGGRLEAAKEIRPGEWRSSRIVGGRIVEVKKGDIIFVPRGTPHKRDTTERDYSMMLIKVFAQPTPLNAGAPSSSPTPGKGGQR
ncbi:MAG: hypothetical protein M3458_02325 [Acidobacteriota bacterium]|nr:hypothetical protein [Acidobacteriota bacterium]